MAHADPSASFAARTARDLVVAALVAGAFTLGAQTRGDRTLEAQGRGTAPPTTVSTPLPTEPVTSGEPLVYGGDASVSGQADGFIAVTGSYGVGTSVLYVLDTESKQLAVYEARGGSAGSRRLVLVGARRIDLDLQLEGYNDDSDFSYAELKRMFERRGPGRVPDASGTTAPAERPGESGR